MIRRIIAGLLVAVLSFGAFTVAPTDAAPDRPDTPEVAAAPDRPADYVASRTSYEICVWGGAIYHGSHWPVYAWRTLHYGSAHVTQCWYKYKWDTRYNACLQYVWGPGVSKPYWDSYGSGGACW
jgi:hypothetical protein